MVATQQKPPAARPPQAAAKAATAEASTQLQHRPTPTWKRAFDVIVGAWLLVAVSPLMLAIACYIRIVSGGPVIFKQSRLGEMGRYFTIYKFRTMANSGEDSPAASEHRDYVAQLRTDDTALDKPDFGDRLIRGGEFLRGHALDEIPQLFNVLLGDMSLVGPRPEVLHWEDYPAWQLKRLEATPGMTGLWQVSGKNRLSFSEMVRLDLEYIERRSLWLDLVILFKTVRVVFASED